VYEHSVSKMGVKNANTKLSTSFRRTSQTIATWPSKNLFRNSYSGWNVHPQHWFWVRTTKYATERTNQSKLSFHYTV